MPDEHVVNSMEALQRISQSAYGIAKLEEKSQDALNAMKSLQLDIAKELVDSGTSIRNLMSAHVHNPAHDEWNTLVDRMREDAEDEYQDAMDRASADGGTEAARNVMRDIFFKDIPTDAPPEKITLREILEKGGKGASDKTINKVRIVYEVFVRDGVSNLDKDALLDMVKRIASGQYEKRDGTMCKPISYDKMGEVARDLKAIDDSTEHSRPERNISIILDQIANDSYVFQIKLPRSEREAEARTKVPVGGDEASRLWLAEKIKGVQNPAHAIKLNDSRLDKFQSGLRDFVMEHQLLQPIDEANDFADLPDFSEIIRLAKLGIEYEAEQGKLRDNVSNLVEDIFED